MPAPEPNPGLERVRHELRARGIPSDAPYPLRSGIHTRGYLPHVIGRVGAQCGNVHYVTGKVWVTDNAISLQGKQELVPAFYAYFLRSLNLNTMSAGTGQPYVSQEILGPIETPVVSLAEQQEIVRRVAGLFALADQLEQRLAQARKQVDKLTPSLLARAFAGRLVPQNPADEPAEKLLARVCQAVKL
jgi:type I restriction enzyme S subunit